MPEAALAMAPGRVAVPRGMAAGDAVARLMAVAGQGGFAAEHRRDDEPVGWRDIEGLLDDAGAAVQAVDLEETPLARIPAPAVLSLAEGGHLVLHSAGKRWCDVEGLDGRARVRTRVLDGRLLPRAVVAGPDLPHGPTVAARFRRLMASRAGAGSRVLVAALLLPASTIAVADLSSRVAGRALPDGAVHMLGLLAATVLAATLMAIAVTWFRDRSVLAIATWIELSAKRGYLSHALSLPFSWLQKRSLGTLLQGIAGLGAARSLLLERVVGATLDGIALFAYLVAMMLRLWPATLALLAASCVIVLLVLAFGAAQARVQAREVVAQAEQRGYLAELVSGVRTLKASGVEAACELQWRNRYDAELALALRRQRLGLPVQVLMEAVRHGFPAVMLVWGGHAVLGGDIGLGELVAFLLLGVAYVNALNGLLGAALAAMVVWPQLQPMLEVIRESPIPRAGVRMCDPVTLRARNVWFRHDPEADWVVRDLDLELVPGQVHRLDGASGTGKTTLLRLLAGLYVPEKGTVGISGFAPGRVAGQVLYLPQVVQLASGTILDNLRMFSNSASHDRLLAMAAKTGFDDMVNRLPLRYETPLTRGAATLSGGQRQMLALTAALASTSGVLLLDEPMANLDACTAAHMRGLLADSGRIVVIAEHG